jgi:hypothetical protein
MRWLAMFATVVGVFVWRMEDARACGGGVRLRPNPVLVPSPRTELPQNPTLLALRSFGKVEARDALGRVVKVTSVPVRSTPDPGFSQWGQIIHIETSTPGPLAIKFRGLGGGEREILFTISDPGAAAVRTSGHSPAPAASRAVATKAPAASASRWAAAGLCVLVALALTTRRRQRTFVSAR